MIHETHESQKINDSPNKHVVLTFLTLDVYWFQCTYFYARHCVRSLGTVRLFVTQDYIFTKMLLPKSSSIPSGLGTFMKASISPTAGM